MKLLQLSGPPSSGKDTIAKFLYHEYKDHYNITQFVFERYSMPLKTSFSAISNTGHNEFYENDAYESRKDEIIPWLGCSYRQYQINLSELHFKPLYGQDIFARLFGARLEGYDKDAVVVVPDLGFDIETFYLNNVYSSVGMDINDILIIRCHRKGYDFSGDSRSYIYSDVFTSIDINNDGTQEEFEKKGDKVFRSFLNGFDCSKFNEPVEG